MKKRSIKNLDLNKKSISNLSNNEVKGGVYPTFTVLTCWSCLSCPTIDCTEGALCDIIKTEDPFEY